MSYEVGRREGRCNLSLLWLSYLCALFRYMARKIPIYDAAVILSNNKTWNSKVSYWFSACLGPARRLHNFEHIEADNNSQFENFGFMRQ